MLEVVSEALGEEVEKVGINFLLILGGVMVR